MKVHIKRAVDNIISYGDTDIFPFPMENIFFKDNESKILSELEAFHKDFDNYMNNSSVPQERALQAVGYFGFRWGTQIDPLLNAYFLSLVLSIADKIEKERIEESKKIVFSYRYNFDKKKKSLFDKESNWRAFIEESINKSQDCKYVLKCDISDFYPRVYHHRIENSLKKATTNTTVIQRILKILTKLSKNASYGLPVGGPASRLLSELLLNRVDKLLVLGEIKFCRYADDYYIFSSSIEEAYASLILLSEKLHENEGLTIQKSKTQIMTAEEFRSTSEFADGHNEERSDLDTEEVNFLKLRLFYDPYSPTAEGDYEELKGELNKFDIIGMLGREIAKNRINQALTRRLINAVKYLSVKSQQSAIKSIVENLDVLYPVFPSVIILIRAVIEGLGDSTRKVVFESIRELLHTDSYITKVTVNLAFAIRILAHDKSDEADAILDKVYKSESNTIIKRDVILAMAQKDVDYWVSDKLKQYTSMTAWEKRSLLLASHILGDEGKHWREKLKIELSNYDKELLSWFTARFTKNKGWGSLL